MRNSTHPTRDAAPLRTDVEKGHRVRVQLYAAPQPMERELMKAELFCTDTAYHIKEAELLCDRDAYDIMDEFAFHGLNTGEHRAGRPLTENDLLEVMLWALISKGLTADQITRAAHTVEKQHYEETWVEEEEEEE